MSEKALCVIVAMVALPSAAYAEQSDTIGVGMQICALFEAGFRERPADTKTTYASWTSGLLTGLNIGYLSVGRPQHDLSAECPRKARCNLCINFAMPTRSMDISNAVVDMLQAMPKLPERKEVNRTFLRQAWETRILP